jgi:hypothetical protein
VIVKETETEITIKTDIEERTPVGSEISLEIPIAISGSPGTVPLMTGMRFLGLVDGILAVEVEAGAEIEVRIGSMRRVGHVVRAEAQHGNVKAIKERKVEAGVVTDGRRQGGTGVEAEAETMSVKGIGTAEENQQ